MIITCEYFLGGLWVYIGVDRAVRVDTGLSLGTECLLESRDMEKGERTKVKKMGTKLKIIPILYRLFANTYT